jgi:REP element-mobilizing transposase RayT
MARKPRIHFPGALYHVITRGNRRQGIFQDEKDLEQFLTYLSNCKNRFPFCLYAYALMQNHLHFLIEVGEIPLSRIMQSLLFGYAHYFNRRYREVGHLFQGRYKAILCDKDAYLLELVRYIHLNPLWMVFVTMVVKGSSNRWANFVLGIIGTLLGIYHFFMCGVPLSFVPPGPVAGPTVHHILLLGTALGATALITWYAWKWPKQES